MRRFDPLADAKRYREMKLNHEIPRGFLEPEYRQLLVDRKMKEIWAVELDLLSEFDRVCRDNAINYSLAYGTLLGAVRHGGFIPWDNDVDVIMLRDEYQKLCSCAEKGFSEPYFFQNEDSDPSVCRGHAQLRNSRTTGILRSEMKDGKAVYTYNQGVFLDIFILDDVPSDPVNRKSFFKKVDLLKRRISKLKKYIGAYKAMSRMKMPLRRIVGGWLAVLKDRFFGRNILKELADELEALCVRYRGTDDVLVAPVMFSPKIAAGECYEKDIFNDLIDVKFEHLTFRAVRRYEEILTQKYGDWRKHVIGGEAHGGVFFDVHHAYTNYL